MFPSECSDELSRAVCRMLLPRAVCDTCRCSPPSASNSVRKVLDDSVLAVSSARRDETEAFSVKELSVPGAFAPGVCLLVSPNSSVCRWSKRTCGLRFIASGTSNTCTRACHPIHQRIRMHNVSSEAIGQEVFGKDLSEGSWSASRRASPYMISLSTTIALIQASHC